MSICNTNYEAYLVLEPSPMWRKAMDYTMFSETVAKSRANALY